MVHVAQPVAVRIFRAFIERDPVVVTPMHRRLQPTESGGNRWVQQDVGPAETVRFVPATSTSEKTVVRTTQDGRTVNPNWNVLCGPTSQIELGDLLPWGTKTMEVIYRADTPSWRIVFEVIEYDG